MSTREKMTLQSFRIFYLEIFFYKILLSQGGFHFTEEYFKVEIVLLNIEHRFISGKSHEFK